MDTFATIARIALIAVLATGCCLIGATIVLANQGVDRRQAAPCIAPVSDCDVHARP